MKYTYAKRFPNGVFAKASSELTNLFGGDVSHLKAEAMVNRTVGFQGLWTLQTMASGVQSGAGELAEQNCS